MFLPKIFAFIVFQNQETASLSFSAITRATDRTYFPENRHKLKIENETIDSILVIMTKSRLVQI